MTPTIRALLAPAALCSCACVTVPASPVARAPEPRMNVARKPVPLLAHTLAPAEVTARLVAAKEACDARLSAVVAVKDSERNFANTPGAIELALADFTDAAWRLQILKDVHTDAAVRDAAAEVEANASQYLVAVGARRDLYVAVTKWREGNGKSEKLDAERSRVVELMLRDFQRNGLALDDVKLAKLVELRSRLADLSTQFGKHLNENVDQVRVTEAELAGLPPPFAARLGKTPDGHRIVTTKTPDVVPFLENATDRGARKRLYVAYQSREAARNLPLLAEAVQLRDEAAKLLGFRNHAAYVVDDRMAKSSERVHAFLDSLAKKLVPRREADFKVLTALLREKTGDATAVLEPWDVSWILTQWKKRDFTIDMEQVREFFPATHVVPAMFGVYEELLGIRVKWVEGADVWHPDVKLYEIRDGADGALLAWFYADLFPRDGKYGHAAVAPITVARAEADGYRTPIVVLMANFSPPEADRPSLLSFDEVKTLFHEFGHVVHQTLTTVGSPSLSGFNTAWDFVEAPSQMLENWVYEPLVLDRMSGHFTDTTKKLPRETVEKLRAARFFDAGWKYMRQVFFATFDQQLHAGTPGLDPDVLEKKLYRELLGLTPVPETHFAATFGHLMGGYDAGYYGYLWSEVYAADMFTEFEKAGVLNGTLGRKYRDVVLALGRSEEPDVLLERFLGRPASDDAFMQRLGVE